MERHNSFLTCIPKQEEFLQQSENEVFKRHFVWVRSMETESIEVKSALAFRELSTCENVSEVTPLEWANDKYVKVSPPIQIKTV